MPERPLIWFKGRPMPSSEALVPALSPTAQFGLNVFEGIRGYYNKSGQLYLFRLDAHLTRLMQSCRLIGIESPYTIAQIKDAIISIIKINNMHADLAVRVTLFVEGEGSWSRSQPVDMFVAPIYKQRNIPTTTTVQTACTSSWRRIDDLSLSPRIKTGANYINGRYAYLEAQNNGYDLPVFLNTLGKVTESSGSCLMMVRDGTIVTPPITSGVLDSITRDTLLVLARESSVPFVVREIDRSELYLAEEIFLCGSAAELTPVTRIDRFSVGSGSLGPTTSILSERYFATVDGSSDQHLDWLTPVWMD
jgi:branched-chain amino acid aminotransferase